MFKYTKNWFNEFAIESFEKIVVPRTPKDILEVGCFEGQCTCYLISNIEASNLNITCVDPWDDKVYDKNRELDLVRSEQNFDYNLNHAIKLSRKNINLVKQKGYSNRELPKLISKGASFDFIYIDGSHNAPDVLADAVMSFYLLKRGGVLAFDDYLWQNWREEYNPLSCPKMSIDAFSHIYAEYLRCIHVDKNQVFFERVK